MTDKHIKLQIGQNLDDIASWDLLVMAMTELPFVRIPNRKTQKVLRDISQREGLVKTSLEELRSEYK